MLHVFEIIAPKAGVDADRLILTYAERQKSRHRAIAENGEEIGWFLQRGIVLADGDLLKAKSGELIQVVAADEPVSEVTADTPLQLQRAAYHLGNRHVPLQINENFLRYQQDHVLDDMTIGLGLTITHKHAPFHPESGAYHSHSSGRHTHISHEHNYQDTNK